MLILDKNLGICLKNIIIDIFEGVSLHFLHVRKKVEEK